MSSLDVVESTQDLSFDNSQAPYLDEDGYLICKLLLGTIRVIELHTCHLLVLFAQVFNGKKAFKANAQHLS